MKIGTLFSTALVATFALGSTAVAQTGVAPLGGQWLPVGTPGTQTNEFWNNASDDGATCNIGYFVATGFGPCSNEVPTPFPGSLGWTNATYLATSPANVSSRVVFGFGAGVYDLWYIGNVAGAVPTRAFGVRELSGGPVQWLTAGTTVQYASASGFEFILEAYAPTGALQFASLHDAQDRRQFAVFANGTDGFTAQEFLVGAEDNACSSIGEGCKRVADADFNDALARVRVVPEPSTYALMAAGLVGLAAVSRRRRAV